MTAPRTAAEIVAAQAEDDGLWFIAATAPEAYLQQELRRLHAAIEATEALLAETTEALRALVESIEKADWFGPTADQPDDGLIWIRSADEDRIFAASDEAHDLLDRLGREGT